MRYTSRELPHWHDFKDPEIRRIAEAARAVDGRMMADDPDFFALPIYGQCALAGQVQGFFNPTASAPLVAAGQLLPETSMAPANGIEVQRLVWAGDSNNNALGTPAGWGFLWAFIGTGPSACSMVDGWAVGGKFGNPTVIMLGDGELVVPAGQALFVGHSFPTFLSSPGLGAQVMGTGAAG